MGAKNEHPGAKLQRQADGTSTAGVDLHPQGGGEVQRGEHLAQARPGHLGQGLI